MYDVKEKFKLHVFLYWFDRKLWQGQTFFLDARLSHGIISITPAPAHCQFSNRQVHLALLTGYLCSPARVHNLGEDVTSLLSTIMKRPR